MILNLPQPFFNEMFFFTRKCRHRKTGQHYAVKILSRFKTDSTNEVKHLTKCQGHENIVKLYDVLQDEYHTYIIMELLTGGELFDRIKCKKVFTEREASLIMKNLVSAIQYIHSQGIVHRDLKPENILFTDDSENSKLKIVDFGFAKLKPSQQSTTSLQTPCFTLNYAAPEVLNKAINMNASGYDESCDLWSLGVILHTLLSGQVPFCNHTSSSTTSTASHVDYIAGIQNDIIEKIKNSSKSLDLKHKPWTAISESAKSLVKGLLNIDPKKRLTLKEIIRHEWLRDCSNFDPNQTYYENCLSTPKLLSTPATVLLHGHEYNGDSEVIKQLKYNINRAYDAYHLAEKQGLLVIQLKDVFEAPLAQRRRNKRSTSSNASSESNVSTNSICSTLSTSTTSVNNGGASYTPTKKCPSSCGKLGEQTVFNFTDVETSEQLNRPVTRSITHSKMNSNVLTTTIMVNKDVVNNVLPFSNGKYFETTPLNNNDNGRIGASKHYLDICSLDNVLENNQLQEQQQQEKLTLGPVPPLSKRLKRCSTILID